MSRITVIGGTGYAGSHIVTEAVSRGHVVTALARKAPEHPAPGVRYVQGDVRDEGVLASALDGADAAVVALSPRGDMEGQARATTAAIAKRALADGVRLAVVGGAGSLAVAPDGPLLKDTEAFPAEFRAEAAEMSAVLGDLRGSPDSLDWFVVSPAAGFGAWAPGARTGTYRVGGDVLLTDAAGDSALSGADLAVAIVDELERPAHRRERFAVAY